MLLIYNFHNILSLHFAITGQNVKSGGLLLHYVMVFQSCESGCVWKPGFVKSGHIYSFTKQAADIGDILRKLPRMLSQIFPIYKEVP